MSITNYTDERTVTAVAALHLLTPFTCTVAHNRTLEAGLTAD